MVITQQYIFGFILGLILVGLSLLIDASGTSARHSTMKFLRGVLSFIIVIIIIALCISNFALTLTLLVLCTGVIALIDILFFHRRRERKGKAQPIIVEYSRSFFLVLFFVWIIRSFVVQPYRVPTGSLEPTVLPGDFLAVNQFSYGLRFPVINYPFVKIGQPKRGEIALFYYPVDPSLIYVKRVIGVPGDHVVYKDKVLYINGKEMTQQFIGTGEDVEPAIGGMPEQHNPVIEKSEDLDGLVHDIYLAPEGGMLGNIDVVVPPGMYFMMGDNRDNSGDSRVWGYVPDRYLIGKAFVIWMSWDPINHRIRWNRIGKGI